MKTEIEMTCENETKMNALNVMREQPEIFRLSLPHLNQGSCTAGQITTETKTFIYNEQITGFLLTKTKKTK